MSTMEFKLAAFEGPLDLLLFLVNRHKLNIYDIEISLLLDQYLEYIDGVDEDLDQAGDFLAMAARLVYIKTCSLLPRAEEAEELKKELEGELIEYSVCREAAERLREQCVFGDVFVRPPEKLPVNKVFTGTMDPQLLVKAYLGMSAKARSMKPVRAEQFTPIVSARIVTVTSKIVYVLKMLYTAGRCTMAELYEGVDDKSARVATFLAVLELTKSGRIMLNEDNTEIIFNRDAPRRRRERPAHPENAEKTVDTAEKPVPQELPTERTAHETEQLPQPEKAESPAPQEQPTERTAQETEQTPQPEKAESPAPQEQPAERTAQETEQFPQPEKAESPAPQEQPAERTAQETEQTPQPEKAESPAPQEQPAERTAQETEQPAQPEKAESPAPQERTAEKPRTAAAGKYAGAVRAADSITLLLPAYEPETAAADTHDTYITYIPENEAAPARGSTPETDKARIPAKLNRFALRYFWGYPAEGNCYVYRRERL